MASQEKQLLTFFGVPITYVRPAIYGSAVLVIALTAAAVIFTELTPLDALIAGFSAMLLFWFSDIVHQYGHVLAGRRVGYPAIRIRLIHVMSATIYPQNEPRLSPDIHIQRALGGPIASLMMAILFGVLALMFWNVGGMLRFLLGYLFLLNMGLSFGALLAPIRNKYIEFDGGTILHYWRIKQQNKKA